MKEDLRVIKTKKAIEEAFISLVEEKGFENVKIIDIAQRANVNRNTIYLHYSSKEMIIEDLIDRTFTASIANFDISSYVKTRNTRRDIHDMFVSMFNVVSQNIEFYRIVLTDQNLSGYLTLKLKRIKSSILESLKPTLKNEIIIEYTVSGIFGIFRNWIIYDKGSIEENVNLISDLTVANIKKIQFKWGDRKWKRGFYYYYHYYHH